MVFTFKRSFQDPDFVIIVHRFIFEENTLGREAGLLRSYRLLNFSVVVKSFTECRV